MTRTQKTIIVTGAFQGIGAAAPYLRLVQDAEQNCPVSRLLWAEFTLGARLV